MLSKKESRKRKAVTLIEITVALIIVGIVATLALPIFTKTVETTRAQEALAALRQIRTAERIYRTRLDFYFPDDADNRESDIGTINNFLRVFLDTKASRNWDYDIDATVADAFTATATRRYQRGAGRNQGETITIDQDGVIAGTWAP